MKHTWVTGLSVFGVLGAGSAAVLANTTVFNNAGTAGGAISMSASSPTTPGTLLDIPTAETTVGTGISPVPMAQTYAIGSSGTVQLSNANGIITVNSALASAGWTVNSSSSSGSWIVVEFLSADQRVAFNAYLVDGAVQVSVDASAPDQPFVPKNPQEPNSGGAPSGQPTSPATPTATQPDTVLTLPPGIGDDDGHTGADSDD